ncbi:DNA-binding response regulator, OmpR family, contains REC and winged-helix (wHTH) domain [Clostridium amylolyticum]|uniref:Stage 0 sporulation protein A homolog n=1 Tax=Clostridium amylolyticum TaxID=1121298 RepID=A0A1M6F4S2_9CLOT|nr:response regulator transcription factor [Clostridium amylolyticum]SHI92671.1 DNA-binding response regulator, OmpR family, contains REC and winged-helix (wHTH) domain [Clostridium amylolyticum]
MNILIAEDERDIRNLVNLHLSKDGYKIFEAENGLEAINIFEKNNIDLAVLDVMMPIMDGINVLRKIRESSTIPVIFLTARGEESDKILGLGLGADDYIVKPFSPLELSARVQAHLRRYYKYTAEKPIREVIIGDITINKESYTVYKKNNKVDLNAKEYRILELLMDNPGRVFTKKQIYEEVWGEPFYGDENTIMVHISHLRDKIEEDPKVPKYLKTIRGIGYKVENVVK